MSSYGEPLVSDVDQKLGPQIAAALHAQAQFLEFFSVIMGRHKSDKFRMRDLFEADEEFLRLSSKLNDVDHDLIYQTVSRVALEALGRFQSQPERRRGAKHDLSEERVGLARVLKALSPLIDDRPQDKGAGGGLTERLIEGLFALNAGEVTELLKPNICKAKNVNAHSVAMIKYKFFLMKPLLRQAGFSSAESNILYEKYALALWDSVSRWKKDVEHILSDEIRKQIEDELARIVEDSKGLSRQNAERIMSDLSIRLRSARDVRKY